VIKPSSLALAVALVGSCIGAPLHAAEDGILVQLQCSPHFSVQPFYDQKSKVKRLKGVVLVEFSVNAEGRIERPLVLEATAPERLQSSALRVVNRFRCKPGQDWAESGGPERRLRVNVVFKFEDEEVPKRLDESAEVVVVTAAVHRGLR
jgi:TonB family protein